MGAKKRAHHVIAIIVRVLSGSASSCTFSLTHHEKTRDRNLFSFYHSCSVDEHLQSLAVYSRELPVTGLR